jgi:hypothetical protein
MVKEKNLFEFSNLFYICRPGNGKSVRGCGEIGRHARLRIWCREVWGFESLHPHKEKTLRKSEGFFCFYFFNKSRISVSNS